MVLRERAMVGAASEHSYCTWYQQNRTVNESEPISTLNQTLSAEILHLLELFDQYAQVSPSPSNHINLRSKE